MTSQLIASGKLIIADSCALGCLQVKVPLLALNAEDDPVVAAAAWPLRAAEQSSSVVLATTRKGGHVAHFEVGCSLCILDQECVSMQQGQPFSAHRGLNLRGGG